MERPDRVRLSPDAPNCVDRADGILGETRTAIRLVHEGWGEEAGWGPVRDYFAEAWAVVGAAWRDGALTLVQDRRLHRVSTSETLLWAWPQGA